MSLLAFFNCGLKTRTQFTCFVVLTSSHFNTVWSHYWWSLFFSQYASWISIQYLKNITVCSSYWIKTVLMSTIPVCLVRHWWKLLLHCCEDAQPRYKYLWSCFFYFFKIKFPSASFFSLYLIVSTLSPFALKSYKCHITQQHDKPKFVGSFYCAYILKNLIWGSRFKDVIWLITVLMLYNKVQTSGAGHNKPPPLQPI